MQLRIHHVGIITRNIRQKLIYYKALGFSVEKRIYVDKYQKVKVGKVKDSNGLLLELLEPLDKTSPIWNLKNSTHTYHHICYQVENIDKYLGLLIKKKLGHRLTPKTKSVFEKKNICFFTNKDKELFELIEVGK